LIFLAISVVDSVKLLQPFLAPYLRATAKSGDQIGAACCGDVQATAATMNRLLVGKELGPQLVIKGLLDQAAMVRRRWLPRLAQLFMSLPHATNRYLNLLTFFARVAPKEINEWRATLDADTARRLNAVLDASANRRPPRRHPSLLSTSLALLVTGGVLAAAAGFLRPPGQRACCAGRFPGTAQPRLGRLRRDLRLGLSARGRRRPRRGRQGRMPAGRARQRGIGRLPALPDAGRNAGCVRPGGPGGADG
jgi:hypothetical protein